MTSTQVTPRAHRRPGLPPGSLLRLAAIAIAVALVVVGLPLLMRGPRFVDRVTIANPSDMPVEISVAPAGSAERLTLGSVAPGSRADFESVVDMGDRWDVRVVANGGASADATVSRARLEGDDWSYTITRSARAELADRGGRPFRSP